MDLWNVHILTLTSNPQDLIDSVEPKDLIPDQGSPGIWMGECIEDPELTLAVLAGLPDELSSQLFLDLNPKEHQSTEVVSSTLVECLKAPVTEVASAVLKDGCDDATTVIDAAMRTVLRADGCISAVWKVGAKKAVFFVGWTSLDAHEKYHQKIFANPPDCIQQLPNFVETTVVLHTAFRPFERDAGP